MKRCLKCGLDKNQDDFSWKSRPLGRREPRCRDCRNTAQKSRDNLYRLEALVHYSGGTPKCACCDESHVIFLTFDHINGGGTKHRKSEPQAVMMYKWLRKNKYPPGYRVLCMNCNLSYGITGSCPHQSKPDLAEMD